MSKQTGDYATFKFQPLLLRHPTGNLAPPSPTALSIAVPGGNTASLNIASMTQLASPFSVSTATMDGNAPSKVQSVSIGTDGTLSYVYANGKTVPAYSIPLGNVISPDNLTNITGDVFQVSSESGSLVIGTAGTGALGTIQSSELESPTVDLATQLTNMVATQSAYGANSKARLEHGNGGNIRPVTQHLRCERHLDLFGEDRQCHHGAWWRLASRVNHPSY